MPTKKDSWTVYILECADETLYTGITTDIEKRLVKHTNGVGAKYTRGRSPYKVIFTQHGLTKSDALKREAEIKTFTKEQKHQLAKSTPKRKAPSA